VKRRGPLDDSEPGSEPRRIAGEHPLTRSDAGHASPIPSLSLPLSKPTASTSLLADTALTIVLTARGRSRFDASFNGTQLVQASKNPISDAARVLHRRGYSDHLLLVAQHEGAAHYAMRGPLGFWRKVRIREDRGLPRYVAWEPRPRRVGAKKGRSNRKAAKHRPEKKTGPRLRPAQPTGIQRPGT
jgi:hypothetical protein